MSRPAKARKRPGPRLRAYVPGDFSSVRRLWRESGLVLGPSDTRAELERARRRNPDLFLVAEADGRLIGVVLGRFDGRRGWVNHLAVAPELRYRGIGSTLMRELERRLRAKGCPKVNLHVLRANRGICAFYERIGYERATLVFMGKWLRP
ncbi:MAG: GNAT family acetyltransferase [Thermoplasmata archaeon]